MVRSCSLVALVALPGVLFGIDPKDATPPVARKVPHETRIHNDTRVDDYFWLRDKKNPEVIKYLEAENAYTAAVMKPTEPFRERLYKEMLGRIKQTDLSVPTPDRGYLYYSRTVEGKQYPIQCRKKGSLDADEEVMLDGNELAKGEKFFSLGATAVSPDGTRLAFTTDTTGFREYLLSVKDLTTGKLVETKLIRVASFAWAADGRTLFYVTEDHAKRPYRLYRHVLGAPRTQDELVCEEKDELFRLGVRVSRDRKYLFRSSVSATTTEQWYLPSDRPADEWTVILPRKEKHEYSAEHRDGLFYIRTNHANATNFKVVTCKVGAHDPKGWIEFIAHDAKVLIGGIGLYRDHAVVTEREAGLPHVRVIDLKTKRAHRVEFPEPVYEVSGAGSAEFDTAIIRFTYTSLVTPPSVYEYDLNAQERKLLKRTEVLGGYDPSRYASERITATAPGGTKVPVSLVYKMGFRKDGTAPILLYGYGSYGATVPAVFNSARLSLLDRGVVFAHAHVRGGSDLGRPWYEGGKMGHKKNTFTDFIACADHLVKEGYGSRERLVIQGGSAGGLLVGATINMRPDLCKAAVLQVPFVDVLNTMLDPSLPLTVPEYLEWGNPNKSDEYEYMKSYCPYTNLSAKGYPAILVTTSLNDSQVLFHEPTKYVAKLRALKADRNPLLLKCNMDGGHGGASGRYDALKETAFVTAFVLDQMGIKE
jgi:oligopeptidase B